MIEYIIKYYGILFENKSMIHHKKVCQYTFEKKMYYLVHSKSNIRGNVCQTYLMYVSIPMFFPDALQDITEPFEDHATQYHIQAPA